MCVICQNGPAILGGVPAAGLLVARLRRAVGRTTEAEAPEPAGTAPGATPEPAR